MNDPIKKQSIAQSFSRAAKKYDAVAYVQTRIGNQLLAGLPLKGDSAALTALDVGCGTGLLTQKLTQHAHHVIAVDIAAGMLRFAKGRDTDQEIKGFVCADAESLPFKVGSIDLIYSNYALQWCENFSGMLQGVHALLKPGGRFVFSIPVENTLHELKTSWQIADPQYDHVNPFYNVNDVEVLLHQQAFNVLDMQESTDVICYPSVRALTNELKQIGAHVIVRNRFQALTGKQKITSMLNAYEAFRLDDGLLPATWHSLLVCVQKR